MVADIYTAVPIIDEETGEPTGETEQVVDREATLRAKNALGVGTFQLTDIRDSHPYLVRRLADGNCWMVENLDLDLANFAGKTNNDTGALTPENTDLREPSTISRGYWDPTESVQTMINDTYAGLLSSNDFAGLTEYLLGTRQTKVGLSDAQLQYHTITLANKTRQIRESVL